MAKKASKSKSEIKSTVVKTIKRGKDRIAISVAEFGGKTYIDIRRQYQDGKEWKPTGKGIAVLPEEIVAVRNGTKKAQALIASESKSKAKKKAAKPAKKAEKVKPKGKKKKSK